ncbi:MAG TPA: alcohol dehydrogenase catalytic domain-containing protein [Gemmatimonadales bacterium]|nr:alcohol dehydrogenase catalytic domain-containing protein [Gemmatimonadales bacterium]
MRALWLENRRLDLREVPVPVPARGEALVRVLKAGICNTDVELTRGYYPFSGVPGHEFVGVVENGAVALAGRRVVGEINAVCGTCRACVAGRRTHCDHRTVLGIAGRHGAFAEFLTLPVENLHPVPESVPTEAAVFTEPLAAALEIQQQVPIGSADRVLVVGDGKLGQLVAQTLALTRCGLCVVGRHDAKLGLLAARGIATTRGDGVDEGAFDVAVECTGNPDGFDIARRALRPRGTLVLKSTYAGALTLDASAVVVNELTLVGSRCGPFAPALDLLAERRVAVEPLIHARYPIGSAVAAFERAQRPGVLKVLVEISD